MSSPFSATMPSEKAGLVLKAMKRVLHGFGCVCYVGCYATPDKFKTAITTGITETHGTHKRDLVRLSTLRFQTLESST